jgi:hypothetical protein
VTTQPDPRLVEAAKHDPTLDYMIKKGIPLPRERWIKLNWLGDPPEPWCIEHEMEMPEFLQDYSKVKVIGHPHAARPPFRMGATLKAAAEPAEPRRYPSAAAAGETIRLPGGKELPRRRGVRGNSRAVPAVLASVHEQSVPTFGRARDRHPPRDSPVLVEPS